MRENTAQSNFEVLSSTEEQASPTLEEGEVQQTQGLIREGKKDTAVQNVLGSPIGGSISPTYA